ncbi:MAG: hypothetical protein ACKOPF_00625, partial [Candidatus Limnocylindrus sp.]
GFASSWPEELLHHPLSHGGELSLGQTAEGDSLFIFSNPKAGKVKRIRNSGRATLAPCTATGIITGAALSAEATILHGDQMPNVWRLLVKKYGLPARLFALYDSLRSTVGKARSAGIEVRLNP